MEPKEFPTEQAPLLNQPSQGPLVSVTRYRWVVLAIFSLFSFLESGIWDTWGPISDSATVAIGFTTHDYELLSNWVSIGALPTIPVFIWIINSKGARLPVLIGAFMVALGSGLRCLPVPLDILRHCIHAGQLCNCIAAGPVLSVAPLISNVWFPPHERITATSCMVLLGNLGNAASYLVGPAMVDAPKRCNDTPTTISTQTTNSFITSMTSIPKIETTTVTCYSNEEKMRKQINTLLYMEFAIAVVTLLLTIFLFKNKPRNAPSASAAAERLQIIPALRMLWRKKEFWATSIALSLAFGAYYGWYGIITLLVGPHGISQNEAGQATFVMTIIGSFIGILIGWFSDRMKGHMKWSLFAVICAMFVSFLYLVVMLQDWIDASPFKFTRVGFWVSLILYGSAANAMQALTLEIVADIGFPVQEGFSSSVFAWFMLWSMFAFLTTLNSIRDPNIGNYLVVGFTGLAIPILGFFTPNQNNRLRVDESGEVPQERRNDLNDDNDVNIQN